MPWGWFSRGSSKPQELPAAEAASDALGNDEARNIAASMPSHKALFDQVKDGPCKVEVARLIACNAKSGDCSKFFLMASRCTAKEAAPSQSDSSDDSAELDKETNGDVGDATLVKRIFYSDDVKRKEGVLAHTLQKIDITGKVLNPDREEVDDELKEELVEAKGINRIFDDSDKNRNHIGWLGTMAQTYFPRFFTPDDDDDDEEEDEEEEPDSDDLKRALLLVVALAPIRSISE